MFEYEESLQHYVNARRDKVLVKNAEMLDHIERSVVEYSSNEIVRDITLGIASAVRRCITEIHGEAYSTLAVVSNLRFLVEACIAARLLVKEEDYKYKFRYAVYKHQIEKSRSLTEFALRDLERLEKLKNDEKAIMDDCVSADKVKDSLAITDRLYDRLDEEISMFLDLAEFNGADFHKTYIEKFLKAHAEREQVIDNEWKDLKQELLKDESIGKVFDFSRQVSKVEKELQDKRDWKTKASVVGLAYLYEFIYDYTSSLIHCTSYSILIPNELTVPEKNMIVGLAIRITNDILRNLSDFSSTPGWASEN